MKRLLKVSTTNNDTAVVFCKKSIVRQKSSKFGVFNIRLADRYLPELTLAIAVISYATTAEGIDEERRLLYVGITRARSRLRLSWSHQGQGRGQSDRRPSRFVEELRIRTPDAVGSSSS